jgi:predicted SprT family Zn-dependent metalloprotease
MTEKRRTNETIDLCDSSSYDEAANSDFTVTDDDDNNLVHKKPNKQVVANKKRDPGRSKASFRRNRDQITASAFDEFNRNAFGGKLEKVVVEWSKKLNTTAGLTRLKKLSTDMTPGVPLKRHAIIELSTKVVDDEEKLRTTLLHELVHAAVWIFEGVSRPPHGADFKRWAKIAMSKVPDVVVTTTHSYHIQYKFNWACINPTCSFVIGRHSKSVDTIRHRCGLCRGKLIEVTSDGAPKKRAQPSAYNLFVKQHSKAVRERLAERHPSVNQADVMKELGRLWRNKKAESSICRLEPVA